MTWYNYASSLAVPLEWWCFVFFPRFTGSNNSRHDLRWERRPWDYFQYIAAFKLNSDSIEVWLSTELISLTLLPGVTLVVIKTDTHLIQITAGLKRKSYVPLSLHICNVQDILNSKKMFNSHQSIHRPLIVSSHLPTHSFQYMFLLKS